MNNLKINIEQDINKKEEKLTTIFWKHFPDSPIFKSSSVIGYNVKASIGVRNIVFFETNRLAPKLIQVVHDFYIDL